MVGGAEKLLVTALSLDSAGIQQDASQQGEMQQVFLLLSLLHLPLPPILHPTAPPRSPPLPHFPDCTSSFSLYPG